MLHSQKEYGDLDWLRANCKMVHYFGLGFIQLKLTGEGPHGMTERMHFYIPGLEPIVPFEDVHNHRYDFGSKVLKGSLSQQLFRIRFSDNGGHEVEDVTCNEGETPTKDPYKYDLIHDTTHTYKEGSGYFISHEQLHRVIVSGKTPTVTVVTRGVYMKERAQVVRPIGGPTVCPFSKKIPEPELWAHIEEALR